MAEARTAIEGIGHPAPHRDRVGVATLAFGLVAGPLAWAGQLFVNYAVASRVCFSGAQPQAGAGIASDAAWLTLLIVELLAMAITLAAAIVAYASWQSTRHEAAGEARHMFEAGEGRTRFLALWGLMTSAGFLVALVFSLVGLLVVPLCGT